ncbi:MAG: hypothetical protein NXI14_04665 [bacterium]|nr:hypothetical protein [bacterium]
MNTRLHGRMTDGSRARLLIGAALLIGATALMGCQQRRWGALTRFEFSDLSVDEGRQMLTVFNEAGLNAALDPSAEVTTIEAKNIRTTKEVSKLIGAIREKSKQMNKSQPLTEATLRFGRLQISGTVYTSISIAVSPNARAFVADRQKQDPWREVKVEGGRFEGVVNTEFTVADQGGWVYIAAFREGAARYSRVNVLTGKVEAGVPLPAGLLDVKQSRAIR